MINKGILEKLYAKDKKSMQEIADHLQCSLHGISYWMNKYEIKRRSRGDAMYCKYNPKGDPFLIKTKFSREELVLLGLGLGLWWGEGTKRNRDSVRLGNTDPQLIKKFIEFLEKICGVKKDKIHFGLQVFSDINPRKAKQFWVRSLGVSAMQFYKKIVVTPARSIGTYREKTKHGVLMVICSNVKLRIVMDELLQKYADIAQ